MASGNQNLWHTTTDWSVAARQQTSFHTPTVVGLKRPLHEVQGSAGHVHHAPAASQRSGFTRPSISAGISGPPRLAASVITYVEENTTNGPSQYTQRMGFAATPSSTIDPLLNLGHHVYALPPPLVANFASMGIKEIYPWQKSCLLGPGLLRGEKNLVYSAPTGGGKSLVADVLMLKQVLADPTAKAILVLPYVALVQEKVGWLRRAVQGIPRTELDAEEQKRENLWSRRPDWNTVRVVGFFGGGKVRATWADFDIAVCTIEKANSLINSALEEGTIADLKVIVLDELHMIDDDHRGYILELLASKLLCLDHKTQIVGMSATLTNINLLRTWLEGHSYETRYRPIPTKEHLVNNGKVYAADPGSPLFKTASRVNARHQDTQGTPSSVTPIRLIQPSVHKELKDPVLNAVVALASETVLAGFGALVFAGSRAGCESDALLISRVLPSLHEVDPTVQERRLDLLGELRSLTTGFDPVLEQTIPFGVAFHHAGLTTEERDLVANGYHDGAIKVCVATCSLAAGINLPARRVILHNARMGRDLIGPSMLRQMRGRAGRKGKDEVGETYLCCRKEDLDNVLDLMQEEIPLISSCLASDQRRIQRALLESIAIRLATSRESLDTYIRHTMLYHSVDAESVNEKVNMSLENLITRGFITVDQHSDFQATKLGKAIVASSIDPEDGLFIHSELRDSLRAFVMDGELHVLYNFTPIHSLDAVPVNWKVFWTQMEQLDESSLRVMEFLGLKPAVVSRMLRGGVLKETTPEEVQTASRYRRFYLALQLRDLCNETPVHVVAQRYDMPRGSVQNLAQTSQGFAAGMVKFCEHMGWGIMAVALDHLSDRLRAGARSDLLALAKIVFVKSRTARIFWDNGFKTVASVANVDPKELVPILMQARPNKVRVEGKNEDKYLEKLLAKARVITDSANRIWQNEMQYDMDEE